MEKGVQLNSPETVFFSFDTEIGKGTVIEQNVIIAPAVTIEEYATVRAFLTWRDVIFFLMPI